MTGVSEAFQIGVNAYLKAPLAHKFVLQLVHPLLIASNFGQDVTWLFNKTGQNFLGILEKPQLNCSVNTLSGCNWYGFGAVFFGCLSMV